MRRKWIAGAAVAALFALPLAAQPGGYGPGYGMGPGMMGAYGPGYGMGPGMMGAYGPGYGMGPGMMGAYGPGCGYGSGMGPGTGPGVMHGYGPRGAPYGALGLDAEQRSKIADIQKEMRRKHWALMETVHEQSDRLAELQDSASPDEAALRRAYDALADAQKRMFESRGEARKRIDAVLTEEQRATLARGWRRGWGG